MQYSVAKSVALIYIYDEIGFKYRKKSYAVDKFDSYIYGKNLQGDITEIYNESGTAVVKYLYDALGNIISTTGTSAGTVGAMNPFRYRGYYYDSETGFYFLQSRYYDPVIGRFINADDVSNLGADGALTGYNLYSYCGNNPVMKVDEYGEAGHVAIGAAVGAIVGLASQFISDLIVSAIMQKITFSSWQTYLGAAVGGAAGGAVLALTGDPNLANITSGVVTTAFTLGLEKIMGKSNMSWGEIVFNSIIDGAVSYSLGKVVKINKVTCGKGNQDAVYRAGLTKLRNGTARKMSNGVILKGVNSSVWGGIATDAYSAIKTVGYYRLRYLVRRRSIA